MQRNSGYLSILIGVSILISVALGLGGIAYYFYNSEIAQTEEESSDTAQDDSPFEQSNKEQNMVTTPVPEETGGGSGPITAPTEGIPTGTYSNPPTTINSNSFDSSDLIEKNPPLNNFDSSVESNRLRQKSMNNSLPDYSSPSSSNDFKSTSENSLIKPLDDNEFLEVPTTSSTDPSEIPSLAEPSLFSNP